MLHFLAHLRALPWAACLIAASGVFCTGQTATPPAARPRIGLVLEGGAALGLAHIGVLQWLEENHIPVDMIAGTSMGGLIGGLYASGMSPAELRTLVGNMDWDDLIGGRTAFRDLTFRRKQDRRDFPSRIQIGIDHGLSFPSGLNAGHQIGLLLDRKVLAYSGLKTFQDLPIPFRCVGTDLVSGKQVVFKDGSLAEALRATMSLPAIFTPVRNPGTIVTDGGLLNNLPVDVARDMGADIIIAVYLGTEPLQADQSLSLFDVLQRSLSVMIAANELRAMQQADVLLTADLAGIGNSDYNRWEEITPRGYDAAKKKARVLSAFALDDRKWQAYIAARDARQIKDVPPVRSIEVSGVSGSQAEAIKAKLEDLAGTKLDSTELDPQLTQLTGDERYSAVSYTLSPSGVLTIRPHLKTYGPGILIPGVELDASELNNFRFAIVGRVTLFDVGAAPSEWRTDFSIGSRTRLFTEYAKVLSPRKRWFVAPRAFAQVERVNFYVEGKRIAEYQESKVGGGADIGYAVNRLSEVRLGYETGRLGFGLRIGLPDLPSFSGRYGVAALKYTFDGVDDPYVPRQGYYATGQMRWIESDPLTSTGFPQAEGRAAAFQRVNSKGSVFVQMSGGSSFGRTTTALQSFALGGPLRLGAYAPEELRGDGYFLGSAGYLHEIGRLSPIVGGKIALVGLYEAGKVFSALTLPDVPQSFSGGVIVQTPLGPMLLGAGAGDGGRHQWFFRLGRVF